MNPAPGGVHTHGPEEGPGLRCPEYRIGDCRLVIDPDALMAALWGMLWDADASRFSAKLAAEYRRIMTTGPAMSEGRVVVHASAGTESLVPGDRLDIFRADGSRIGVLVYGTSEEIEAAETRLATK